jgi:hypothetical protein
MGVGGIAVVVVVVVVEEERSTTDRKLWLKLQLYLTESSTIPSICLTASVAAEIPSEVSGK